MFTAYEKVIESFTDEEIFQGDILSYFNFTAAHQQ
jgi:hypothetical protein